MDGTVKTEKADGAVLDVTPGRCLLRSVLFSESRDTFHDDVHNTGQRHNTGHKQEGKLTPKVLCKNAQRTTGEGKE